MQNSIIDKAKKLGLDTGSGDFDDNLRTIASQVGLHDFNSETDLETLNGILDEKLNIDDKLNDVEDLNIGEDAQNAPIRDEAFGQKEYDRAKKNGVYNADHYKNRQQDLDKKADELNKERKNNWKTKKGENGPVKADGSNAVRKSKMDMVMDNLKYANAKKNAITNKIDDAKAKAYNATHPGEAIKDKAEAKVKEVAKDTGKKAATAVGNAGKKAASKTAKVTAKAGAKLVAFIAANPWVLLVLIVFLLIFLILLVVIGDNSNGNGYFNEECNYNLTTINLKTCNSDDDPKSISIKDYVIGSTLSLIEGKELSDEAIKAIMIVVKTNAFAKGGYDNASKVLDLDTCTNNYNDSQEGDTYEKLNTLYANIENYLFLSNEYKSEITTLKESDMLDLSEDFINSISSEEDKKSYSEILNKFYDNNDDNVEMEQNTKIEENDNSDNNDVTTEDNEEKTTKKTKHKIYNLADHCEFIQTDENSDSSSMCATNSESANLFTFVSKFEGITGLCNNNTGYVAENLGDGTITVGHGVTNHLLGSAYTAHYINTNSWEKYFRKSGNGYKVNAGDCVPISVADKIKINSLATTYSEPVDTAAQKHGVTFTQYQKDALTSFNYNLGAGYTEKLVKAYADGGYESLWKEMKQYNKSQGKVLEGLKRRRKAEFALFVTGDYTDQNKFYSRDVTNYDDYNSENVIGRQAVCNNGIGGIDSPNCTIYAQGDPRWSSISLGGAGSMGEAGCAVTSIAIGISCSGVKTTVPNFDAGVFIRKLNAGKCFVGNGSIIWTCAAISQIAPGVKQAAHYKDILNKSIDEKKQLITKFPQSNYFVIVHFQNEQHKLGHYVVVSSISGNNLIVKDPSGGVVSTIPINIIDRVLAYSTKG